MPISLEFTTELCYPSGSIDIYLTFQNSKNIIPRIRLFNDGMCEHLLPYFHILDLWSRICDRRVTITRPWREINRQVQCTSVRYRFRECSVQSVRFPLRFDPLPNYGYSAEWSGLFSSKQQCLPTVRRRWSLLLLITIELLSDSNATLMLLLFLYCLTPKRGDSAGFLWNFKPFFDRRTFEIICDHDWVQ